MQQWARNHLEILVKLVLFPMLVKSYVTIIEINILRTEKA